MEVLRPGTGSRFPDYDIIVLSSQSDIRRAGLLFRLSRRLQSLTRFFEQNRGASLPALDDEYRPVINDIGFADLL
jgi:hypothetical protein